MKTRLLIIVLIFPCLINAQSKLAIIDCNLAGVEDSYKQIIIDMLIEEYKKSTDYNVFPYDNINSVIKDKGLENSRLSRTQMIQIAKELNADFVGFGSVAKFGETYTFTFKILDVFQENEVFSQNKRFNSFDKLPDVVKINSDEDLQGEKHEKTANIDLPSVYHGGVLYLLPYTYYDELLWSPADKTKIPTGAVSLNEGEKNTEQIVKTYGEGNYAAKICYDLDTLGFSDWYLPSKEELATICDNKDAIGGFNFDLAYYYWSSTEMKKNTAWVRLMPTCLRATSKKSDPRPFRCVRRD